MANTFNYATLFQSALDEAIVADLTSAGMEANSSLIQYNGGNSVKIGKLTTSQLGQYDRASGYHQGSATLVWEEKTFTQDRGESFTIDAQDVDETAFAATASNVLGTFQREQVVPQVDSYRYSKIFNEAIKAGSGFGRYTLAASTILSQLQNDIGAVRDNIGQNEPLVCYISGSAYNILANSTELSKSLGVAQFEAGGVSTEVKTLNGVPLIFVPSDRMKSHYAFSASGYGVEGYAGDINWIITARRAVVAVVKTDKVRVFDPDTNQSADAWKVQLRKYHDCWVMENKANAIYVNLKDEAAKSTGATASAVSSGSTTLTAVVPTDGGALYYKVSSSAPAALKLFDEFSATGYTKVTAASTSITATAGKHLELVRVDADNRVLAFDDITLA